MRIAVDVDGCVADLAQSLVKRYNIDFNDNIINYYDSYWFEQCVKADSNYFNSLMHEQFTFLNIIPIQPMIDMIKKLHRDGWEIIFCTTPIKNKYCKHEKLQWLERYFGDIEYSIMFTNNKNMVDADIMIDDDLRHLKLAQQHPRMIPICIGNYHWNQEWDSYRFNINEVDKLYDWLCAFKLNRENWEGETT